MRIEQIRLKNFKTFQDVTLKDLQPFTVLVGANGSGKSTLFDVFGFLRDCLKDNVRSALARRGGFREVSTRGHSEETIEIELKIRMPLKIGDKSSERTVTYQVEIGSKKGDVSVVKEQLRYTRFGGGKPYNFLRFENGVGEAIKNEADIGPAAQSVDREMQRLESPDILAIKGLGQFQRFEAASALRSLIENWHVSDFHISAARTVQDAGFAEHLSAQGENLPLVARYLYENHRDVFDQILKSMGERVPGVTAVEAQETADGRIVLRFTDGSFKDPFIARYVSDGTIKMFAYLVLLHDPKAHPLLCVEEPENQLYPDLLGSLAEEFAAYSRRGGQVFVSTHSPDFLNEVPLDSILWLRKQGGLTTVHRARDDKRLKAWVDGGERPGYLWRQGAFEGAGPNA
jgi:predicted ATPase